MAARRKGYSYVANIQIAFTDVLQAESFCLKGTLIGERVALDLEDEEVLELFEKEDALICEISYPDGLDPQVQEEVVAAGEVGAEIDISFKWEKNAR